MNRYIELLSKIDFEYWKEINPYFSDNDLVNSSMKRALTTIQNKGFLLDFDPKTAADYVNSIESLINSFDESNPNYDSLARIFDLIQAWGGQMGKHPYVITKSRFKFDVWKEDYLDGVSNARSDKPVQALSSWLKISGLGASFAPKHLRFWTSKYPVLDTRISLLVSGSKKLLTKPEYYDEFLELIAPLSVKFGASILELEKALFAFSQNFFLNDKLEFKANDLTDEPDFYIAKSLMNLSS